MCHVNLLATASEREMYNRFCRVWYIDRRYTEVLGMFSLWDLYRLFLFVIAEGGFARVNRNHRWIRGARVLTPYAIVRIYLFTNHVSQEELAAPLLKEAYVTSCRDVEHSLDDVKRQLLTLPRLRCSLQ